MSREHAFAKAMAYGAGRSEAKIPPSRSDAAREQQPS